jgi:Ca-activated chloride channel family protein
MVEAAQFDKGVSNERMMRHRTRKTVPEDSQLRFQERQRWDDADPPQVPPWARGNHRGVVNLAPGLRERGPEGRVRGRSIFSQLRRARRWRERVLGIRQLAKRLVLVLGCFTLFVATSGQIWQDKSSRKNTQGNELYRKKDYDAALEQYMQAQDGKNHQQELSYNVANTLYQQKKYPEATRELEKSLSAGNAGLNQKIYFNRGNSFYQMKQYPQAVESYKKALELDPKDRDAKFNLELALKRLQENPEKKKENSPDKDQKKQDSSSKENQQSQNQQSDQQKPSKPREQDSKGDSQKEAKPNERDSSQNQPQKGEQKQGMDPKEALRILDAINNQEKKEQRKQVLKIQRAQVSGKDW